MKFDDVKPGMLIRNRKLDAIAWVQELDASTWRWSGYVLDGPPGFTVKFNWGPECPWDQWEEVGKSWFPSFQFVDVSVKSRSES